jgi:hypothetical protein
LNGDTEALKKIPDMPSAVLDAMKKSLKSLGFRVGEYHSGFSLGGDVYDAIIIVPPGSKDGLRITHRSNGSMGPKYAYDKTEVSAVTVSDQDKPFQIGDPVRGRGTSEGPEITGESKTSVADELNKISDAARKALLFQTNG